MVDLQWVTPPVKSWGGQSENIKPPRVCNYTFISAEADDHGAPQPLNQWGSRGRPHGWRSGRRRRAGWGGGAEGLNAIGTCEGGPGQSRDRIREDQRSAATPPLLVARKSFTHSQLYTRTHVHAHAARCTPTPSEPRGERGGERSTRFSRKAENRRSRDHRSAFRSRDKRRRVSLAGLSTSLPPAAAALPGRLASPRLLAVNISRHLAAASSPSPRGPFGSHFQLTVVRLLHKHIDHAPSPPHPTPPPPSFAVPGSEYTASSSSSSGLIFIISTRRWIV